MVSGQWRTQIDHPQGVISLIVNLESTFNIKDVGSLRLRVAQPLRFRRKAS